MGDGEIWGIRTEDVEPGDLGVVVTAELGPFCKLVLRGGGPHVLLYAEDLEAEVALLSDLRGYSRGE